MSGVWAQIDQFLFLGSYKNVITVSGLYPQLQAHRWRIHFWVVGRTHFSVAVWLQIPTLAGWRLEAPLKAQRPSVVPCPVGFFSGAWASLSSQGHLLQAAESLRQCNMTATMMFHHLAPSVRSQPQILPTFTERGLHKCVTSGDGNHWVPS